MKKNTRYRYATNKAYEILLYNNSTFPIDVFNINIPDMIIKIISMQYYSSKCNVKLKDLTQNGTFNDGYIILEKGRNRATVLYNENIECVERKRFTIAHEIGHIVLGHEGYSIINEKEADVFASQLLLPHCILERLIKLGKKIDVEYLNLKFGLSHEAAKISIERVYRKIRSNAKVPYEKKLLELNKKFLEFEVSS